MKWMYDDGQCRCRYPKRCADCGRCNVCQCTCWNWSEHDNVTTTAVATELAVQLT